MPAVVHGLRELVRANSQAEPGLRREFKREYRKLGEPVRQSAESRAMVIGNVPRSPQWGRMRTGATQKLLYVAPKQRGVKTRGRERLKRPNMGTLLMDRAMQPALDQHEGQFAREFDRFLAHMARRWER